MRKYLFIGLLCLPTIAHAQQIHIYCGPGLSGCSDKPVQIVDPGYTQVSENVVAVTGTHMRITFSPDSGNDNSNYAITWGATSRYADTPSQALALAHTWAEQLAAQGQTP